MDGALGTSLPPPPPPLSSDYPNPHSPPFLRVCVGQERQTTTFHALAVCSADDLVPVLGADGEPLITIRGGNQNDDVPDSISLYGQNNDAFSLLFEGADPMPTSMTLRVQSAPGAPSEDVRAASMVGREFVAPDRAQWPGKLAARLKGCRFVCTESLPPLPQ